MPSLQLPGEVSVARLDDRRRLLAGVDRLASHLDSFRDVSALDSYYQQALGMISSAATRQAFDLAKEDPKLREHYGMHTFGQSCLLARRLIEAGVRLVTVYWHRDKPGVDTTWDTHAKNFPQLKERLMPESDSGFAALLGDLEQRGLLDDTLVVWSSEFGRTPKINGNGGRDHWGPANSVVFAGGGVRGGQVHGATDDSASAPSRDPVSPDDIAATIYTLLGVPSETEIRDMLDRPHRIALGEPIAALT